MIKYSSWIIIYFFLFSKIAYSNEILKKSYLSKDCEGDESICGDPFVFEITFQKKDNLIEIINSNLLDHKHVEKISDHKFKIKDKNFFINFFIINNLENKFDFEIIGEIIENKFEAKSMIITFSDQFLAEYKLILL
jgi:hypothetical protein|tara:strand:- start:612 stop:1019 length:408 start_codon:yes stop_codon:yes gene_type:complete